ncbi:MAG: hypothetical protein U0166_21280 [Acidobacteriota bacterium]
MVTEAPDAATVRFRRRDAAALALPIVPLLAWELATIASQTVTIGDRRVTVLPFDDVYVTMRYARHLAGGLGLRWNPGEAPIEGFTSPLWMAAIALFMRMRADPEPLMIAACALCHAAAVAIGYLLLVRRLAVPRVLATIGGVVMAAWIPIGRQVVTGGEMAPLLAAFVLAVYLLSSPRDGWHLAGAGLAGLLPAIRPEALVLTILVFFGLGRGSGQRFWREAALFLLPAIVLVAGRGLLFGSVVPNTYDLKVFHRPERWVFGARYVRRFLEDFPGSLLIPPLLVSALLRAPRWVLAMAIGVPLVLCDVAVLGGDPWDTWRFMLPILPMLLVVLGDFSAACWRRRSLRVAVTIVWAYLLVATLVPLATRALEGRWLPPPRPASVQNARLGLLLRAACRPDALVAEFWAGTEPYFSDLPTLDMLGKTDRHIARLSPAWPHAAPGHDKVDFAYVLARRPDVIVSHHAATVPREQVELWNRHGLNPFGAALLADPAFERDYAPVDSVLSRLWHGIYVRRGSEALDLERLAEVERTLVRAPVVFVDLEGWGELEQDWGSAWCFARRRVASIELDADHAGDARLALDLAVPGPPATVVLRVNGTDASRWDVTWAGFHHARAAVVSLRSGRNVLEIEGPEPVPVWQHRLPQGAGVRDLALTIGDVRCVLGS